MKKHHPPNIIIIVPASDLLHPIPFPQFNIRPSHPHSPSPPFLSSYTLLFALVGAFPAAAEALRIAASFAERASRLRIDYETHLAVEGYVREAGRQR